MKASKAIEIGRSLIGTPYSELDCINLIKRILRKGGYPNYTTAGTNALWRSYTMSSKYRDLTWRERSCDNAKAGMLAFKISGSDVHHVGLVTERGTVIHSSSVAGKVVETELDNSWHALAVHRYIEVAEMVEHAETVVQEAMSADRATTSLCNEETGEYITIMGKWRIAED